MKEGQAEKYMSKSNRASSATIKDIAKYAGVSIATVSRYVNQKSQVKPLTAIKLQEAIEHFGYIPNDNARALRSKSERIIGLVLPDISNSFFAKVSKILEELLFEKKIFVLLCNSDENGEKECEYLYRLLQKRVDAIVIAPTGMNDSLLENISKTTPVITFDRKLEHMVADELYANDEETCAALTGYVLDKGHRHIAYSMGVPNSSVTKCRYHGFSKAVEERKMILSDCLMLYDQDEATCRKTFRELLLQTHFTAIIITSPKKLDWFLIERNQLFLKGEASGLSFAGYATQNEFGISEPPLTGLLQREEAYAGKLAKIIVNRLERPDSKPKTTEIKLPFRHGRSVVSKSENDDQPNHPSF